MMRAAAGAIALALLVVGVAAAEEEERRLEGMAVIGNSELPKALFIVPWKQAAFEGAVPPPSSALVGIEPAPLDPEVFRRELELRRESGRSH